jgi:hypothetical protein
MWKSQRSSYFLSLAPLGTGKSQFMKYAAKLSARSVMTTGMGSTGAGLTVTAVKDNGKPTDRASNTIAIRVSCKSDTWRFCCQEIL